MSHLRIHVTNRAALLCGLGVVAATVATLPFAARQLDPAPSFLPAVLAVVFCLDLMSIYLLVGDYRDSGNPRTLVMSWAYLYSLVMVAAYPFVFPGVFLENPPFAVPPPVAPWLYLGWHVGFPVLLGVAWAPWPARAAATIPAARRRLVHRLSFAVVLAASVGLVALFVRFAEQMPVLIQGLDNSRMATLTAPVAAPLVLLSLLGAWLGLRGNTGPERWTVITVLVCACDLLLTYSAGSRYSLGWYSGRSLTVVSAGIVLVAMLVGFRRLKAQAEFYAAYDSLTGLPNRRSAYDMLARQFAHARRSGEPFAVALIDVDLFKQVNDKYGHEAGDLLLASVSKSMSGSLRAEDVVARVGGEEFLALLPGADEAGALEAAERIRCAVAGTYVAAAGGSPTASLGVACLSSGDTDQAHLLRRVDQALYQAKHAGRNRSVLAPAPEPSAPAEAGGLRS